MFFFIILCLPFLTDAIDKCPVTTPVKNLRLDQYYTGRWFEAARYDSTESEKDADCVYFDLSFDGKQYKYNGSEVVNNNMFTYYGTADYADAKESGTIVESVNFNGELLKNTYDILDIDYNKYALLYYCKFDEKTNKNIESAWILSRSIKMEGDIKNAIESTIKNHPFLDSSKLIWDIFTHETCMIDL